MKPRFPARSTTAQEHQHQHQPVGGQHRHEHQHQRQRQRQHQHQHQRQHERMGYGVRGFTLIEVLVALAVVAVTLAAGLQATGALTRAATRQTDQWLAQICAENELTRLRLLRQLPGVGDATTECTQAGRTLQVRLSVLPTPNPNFRRVDSTVAAPVDGNDVRLLTISTVLGRY